MFPRRRSLRRHRDSVFLRLCGDEISTHFSISYIDSLDYGEHPSACEVSYRKEDGVYTLKMTGDELKILQLTDIHLCESLTTVFPDRKALKACYDVIQKAEPDLILVTGDLVYPVPLATFNNNMRPFYAFFASWKTSASLGRWSTAITTRKSLHPIKARTSRCGLGVKYKGVDLVYGKSIDYIKVKGVEPPSVLDGGFPPVLRQLPWQYVPVFPAVVSLPKRKSTRPKLLRTPREAIFEGFVPRRRKVYRT